VGISVGLPSASILPAVIMLGFSQAHPQAALAQYRINCSGPAFTDAQGTAWMDDAYFTNGEMYTGSDIFSAGDYPQLYQDVRWNDPRQPEPMKYTFPLAEGSYTVRLHFAEIWYGAYQVGGRVFNVSINGALVAENLDVFAEAGSMAPLVKEYTVPAVNGNVVIDFTNVTQNAAIAGIEVLPASSTGIAFRNARTASASPQGALRVQVSLSGSLALAAPARNGKVRLLNLQGGQVASRRADGAGNAFFHGLAPGIYWAAFGE
jgi:hypothetical protein